MPSIREHLDDMECYIVDASETLARLTGEDEDREGISGWVFEAYVNMANLHATAARLLVEGQRWEEERMPPLTIEGYRGTQDTPLPDLGGGLGGTVGGHPPTAPPYRPTDPHGEKEE